MLWPGSLTSIQLFFSYPFFSIVALRRRKASSAAKTRTSEADQNVEKVRYTTGGGGGSVGLRENIDYEVAEYQDADVYEETK